MSGDSNTTSLLAKQSGQSGWARAPLIFPIEEKAPRPLIPLVLRSKFTFPVQ
jgi:hypothetical protein